MKVCSACQWCYSDTTDHCTEVSHPALSELRSGSPEMLAGYRIEQLLETGVRGEKFRAREITSGRTCFVKILPVDDGNRQKLFDDAKLAGVFYHPNVADIYDAGVLETGEIYVAGEEAEGQSLRELLQTIGPPQLLTSIQIVRQTAEAVHALHSQGLIHGNVRPENIILGKDHEDQFIVRVQDPDLGGVAAKSIVSNKFLIDTVIDSLRYFSPEQCSGEAATVKSDVYSLGIVLFEMLTGEPPFDAAKAVGVIEKHRSEHPPEIRIDNFDLRMLLTHTLMESLQKQPRFRQSSANVFARQMRHIEQLATHTSTPPPAGIVPAQPRPQVIVAAASPAATVIRAASVVEETPATYRKVEARTTDEVEVGPIEILAEREQDTAEAQPPLTVPAEPEIPTEALTKVISLEVAAADGNSAPELVPAEPHVEASEEKPVVQTPSRLKRRKKRLHPIVMPATMPEVVEQSIAMAEAVVDEGSTINMEDEAQTPAETPPPEVICGPASEKIHWEQPEDDIPSKADVATVLEEEEQAEPEEVFVAPVRITVPIAAFDETPVRPGAVDEVELFSAFFREPKRKRSREAKAVEPIFTAYAGESGRSPLARRAFMIGGGFVALAVTFIIGDVFVGRSVQSESPEQVEVSRPAPEQPVTNKTSGSPARSDGNGLKRRVPALSSGPAVTMPGVTHVTKDTITTKARSTKSANPAKPAGAEAVNSPARKDAAVRSAPEHKPATLTRPRIVQNPQP